MDPCVAPYDSHSNIWLESHSFIRGNTHES